VAKQYMSQSMGWVEDVIFACAPLGIITAIVGAIRVGGPRSMKAMIGRARESKGAVEVELMSSTSADVCELWNGEGVIRVLGSSPIVEIYYLSSERRNVRNAGTPVNGEAIPLVGFDRRMREDLGIWDFKSAVSNGLLVEVAHSSGESTEEGTPNVGLNLGGQRVSHLEMKAVAVIGLLLQLGVIAFAGLGVYLSTWNQRFKKNGEPVQRHAFPSMGSGTVALVIGMFLCCHIVERSTTEKNWAVNEPDENRVMVAWLQRGGTVNDQNFKSYILQRDQNAFKLPEFVKTWLQTDTRLLIRTSHKGSHIDQASLTVLAVGTSLAGFIAQFVGLRGLGWQVTIAQLVATGIMTGLRAWVRRNLVHEPEDEEIESGYELEAMAEKIKGCGYWSVTTWTSRPDGGLIPVRSSLTNESASADRSGSVTDGCKLATEVMDARRRLGELTRWPSELREIVDSVAQAIETTMDFLWTNPDVILKTDRPSDTIEWELFVEVSENFKDPRPVSASVMLKVSRQILPHGAWSPWKADKNNLEAVLGLWMFHLKTSSPGSGSETYRTVGGGDPLEEGIYRQWILPQTELSNRSKEQFTVGKPSNPDNLQWLAARSRTPLEQICGQHVFSTFLANVADRAIESIGGTVLVRGGEEGVKNLFRLKNTVLDNLVERVERTGLSTAEDALLSIVPPLGKQLPTNPKITDSFSQMKTEISNFIEGKQFEQADSRLLWLLDAAESEAWRLGDGPEACKIYCLLLRTYDDIRSRDYADRAEKAMGLFYERLFLSVKKTGGGDALQKTLNIVKEILGDLIPNTPRNVLAQDQILGEISEVSWNKRLEKWEGALREWGPAIQPTPSGTAGKELTLLRAAASGDCARVVQILGASDIDVDNCDSLGRTPLIWASVSGHATVVIQLLNKQASPLLKDRYNRTAIHYAANRNDTLVLHVLLIRAKIGEFPVELDSPLKLAIQNNAGAAAALLLFYGAKDPGKELVGLSARYGSYEAIKAASDRNFKDSKYGRTPLHWAVLRGSTGFLLEKIPEGNIQANAQANDGSTALHMAAGGGQSSTVELLIQRFGANRDAKTNDGTLALHFACAGGHDSTVELLILKFGADKEAKTNDGTSALHLACAGGHDSTVELLIQFGADKEAKTNDGTSALHLACAGGHDSTVELLIQFGADKEAKTNDGTSALHLACAGGHDSTVELLIQFGADKEAKTNDGTSALHFACAGGHDSAVELLIQLGADKEAKTNDGTSALHFACAEGHDSTIELLIQFNINKEAKTNDGTTALHLACEHGCDSAARLLIEKFGADKNAKNDSGQTALRLLAEYMYISRLHHYSSIYKANFV
jgi:ankyrin repeat protein